MILQFDDKKNSLAIALSTSSHRSPTLNKPIGIRLTSVGGNCLTVYIAAILTELSFIDFTRLISVAANDQIKSYRFIITNSHFISL